jgi:diguanylate cyclase (GGDEF)-like protein
MSFADAARCTILLVDDEAAILSLLQLQLAQHFNVITSNTAAEARTILQSQSIDILVADLGLADGSGIELLDWAHKHHSHVARVLLSGTARLQDAADAINCAQIHRLILKPWRAADLLTHMQDVAHTQQLTRENNALLDELRRLNSSLEKRVEERTAQLKTMNTILQQMALTDTLTGLPNRRAIEQIARQELVRTSRKPIPMALGLVDADFFKDVNTKYTHSGGDQALIGLSRILQNTLRGTDAIGRVGGEEFLVVCPATDYEGIQALAERLREQVESSIIVYNDHRIPLTISLGFVVIDESHALSFEQLRAIASTALLQAKTAGRNCVVILRADEKALPQFDPNGPVETILS